jgi:uncharacterized membrane protein
VDLVTRAPAEACLANIGAKGIAQRRTVAAVALALALGGLVALVILDLPHRWRAALFVPFWAAALCWMQAAAKT